MTDLVSWIEDDGGRAEAGFKGTTGDCAVRAVAIAAGLPYRKVYDELFKLNRRVRPRNATGNDSPRGGIRREAMDAFFADLGWEWTPTMGIGTGCTVHLRPDELPAGRLVVRLSKHLCAVVDGVVHDTHDPSRGGTRCVYGYWMAP